MFKLLIFIAIGFTPHYYRILHGTTKPALIAMVSMIFGVLNSLD
jgi:hypothetical protein